MFGQYPIFAYLGLRNILMLCEQAQIGEDLHFYLSLTTQARPCVSNH